EDGIRGKLVTGVQTSALPISIQKLDLGALWTRSTGMPFVYAFWAGWPDAVTPEQVEALQRARDAGVAHAADVARAYYPDDPARRSEERRVGKECSPWGDSLH